MEIINSLPCNNPKILTTSSNRNNKQGKPSILSINNVDKENVVVNILSSKAIRGKPDYKETATKMLPAQRNLGEFKDLKGLDQTTDLHIGPDIRYALTSKNVDFLKRIRWGPLTIGEYREVQYRIRELENKSVTSNNMLSGKLIDSNQWMQTNYDAKIDTTDTNGMGQAIDTKV